MCRAHRAAAGIAAQVIVQNDVTHKLHLQVTALALRERVPEQLAGLLAADHPELRAAAVFTLGALIRVNLTFACCSCAPNLSFACSSCALTLGIFNDTAVDIKVGFECLLCA